MRRLTGVRFLGTGLQRHCGFTIRTCARPATVKLGGSLPCASSLEARTRSDFAASGGLPFGDVPRVRVLGIGLRVLGAGSYVEAAATGEHDSSDSTSDALEFVITGDFQRDTATHCSVAHQTAAAIE